jgi:transcriptional regulator with XRE-family HTH domain
MPVSSGRRGGRTRRKAGGTTASGFYPLRLESARRAFPSDAKVAEALGVNRAQVTRWREGETEPGPGNAERVVALDAAVELLTGLLELPSIGKWLMGQNAHLGDRRPVDLIRDGNLSEVIAAIEALRTGAYA